MSPNVIEAFLKLGFILAAVDDKCGAKADI